MSNSRLDVTCYLPSFVGVWRLVRILMRQLPVQRVYPILVD